MTAACSAREPEPNAEGVGRSALIVVGLLGGLLVFTRVMRLGPISGNFSAADLVLLPALALLYRRIKGHWAVHYWLLAMLVMQAVSWLNGLEFATTDTAKDAAAVLVTCIYALVGFGIGRQRSTERAFTIGTLATVIPVCAVMVVALLTGQPRAFLEPELLRARGPMTDPNGMAIYMAGVLPFIATHSLFWLPPLLAGIMTTVSRSGLAATFLAILSWVVIRRRVSHLIALLVVALPVLIFLLPRMSVTRLMAVESGLSRRAITWGVAWETAKLHPFLGVGKGNY